MGNIIIKQVGEIMIKEIHKYWQDNFDWSSDLGPYTIEQAIKHYLEDNKISLEEDEIEELVDKVEEIEQNRIKKEFKYITGKTL